MSAKMTMNPPNMITLSRPTDLMYRHVSTPFCCDQHVEVVEEEVVVVAVVVVVVVAVELETQLALPSKKAEALEQFVLLFPPQPSCWQHQRGASQSLCERQDAVVLAPSRSSPAVRPGCTSTSTDTARTPVQSVPFRVCIADLLHCLLLHTIFKHESGP